MKVLLLLSGGVDSAVLLADAIKVGHEVHTVTFDYGQLHAAREIAAAAAVAEYCGVSHRAVTLPKVFGDSALLGDSDIPEDHAEEPDATVVGGRNIVFLSIGIALAEQIGAAKVMIGAIHDDAAAYLDCRHAFLDAMDHAARWSTGCPGIGVSAPFIDMSKVEVLHRGQELGVPLRLTWSCYRGGHRPCGHCGACRLLEAARAELAQQGCDGKCARDECVCPGGS